MKEGKMKNKIWNRNGMLVLLLVATCMFAVGVTFAYMFKKSDSVDNSFVAAKVTCEVNEDYDSDTGVKKSVTVKNTGEIAAYVRVKLVSYWKDAPGSGGNIVGKPSTVPAFTLATGWTQAGSDTYVYTNPVAAGASSPNLIDGTLTLGTSEWIDEDGGTITVYQVVDVFAEAIQSEPVSAVNEAWGVDLSDSGTTP